MPRTRIRRPARPALLGLLSAAVAATAALVLPIAAAPEARADTPVVVLSSDFEDGTAQGWQPRADEVVQTSTAAAHGGSRSLLVTGRTRSWEGPVLDLLGTVEMGTRYTVSVRARLAAGESTTPLRLSVERRTGGTPSYDQVVGSTTVGAGGWTLLEGSYLLAHDVDFLTVYVESATGTASFHIDDFQLLAEPSAPIQTDIPAVQDAWRAHFPVGAAIERPQIIGRHAQLLTRHFNSVTPGNQLKWDAVQPAEGEFRFADGDALVDFGRANGMRVRGHTLLWHQQTPAWVFQDAAGAPLTSAPEHKALLLERIEAHIAAVAGRYAGRIADWDVVNEVIDENQPDGLRRSRWYEIAGLDYIRTAFRAARTAAPDATLFINDYNTNVPAKRDHLFRLVQQLRAEGVPIDGVGHQMHINIDWPSVTETEQMLQRFVPLGVEQQITELDVSIYTDNSQSFPSPPADRLDRQATRYRDMFELFRRYDSHITAVTLWGLADDDTWLDTFPVTRRDAPLLFDRQLQAKPAYWAVVGVASPVPSAPGSPSSPAAPSLSPSPSAPVPPSATPSLGPPTPLPVPCRVEYRVAGEWQGGFQARVRLTNAGSHAIPAWALRWSFADGQQITQAWNAQVTQNGADVTAQSLSWNGLLDRNGTVEFGFLGSWQGSNPAPAGVTLNGVACQLD